MPRRPSLTTEDEIRFLMDLNVAGLVTGKLAMQRLPWSDELYSLTDVPNVHQFRALNYSAPARC